MSKLLPIITHPNDSLRKKSKPVSAKEADSPEFISLANDMTKTMLAKDGIGLAAPQIGRNIRMIVINTESGPICLINPEIIKKSWACDWAEEGCLSVPNFFGEVRRHSKITCRFIGINGKKQVLETAGLDARVIQHEIDHLDGVLFIDKAKKIKEVKT